jgi:hypothetical protein
VAAVSCAFSRNPVVFVGRVSSSANPSHLAAGFLSLAHISPLSENASEVLGD